MIPTQLTYRERLQPWQQILSCRGKRIILPAIQPWCVVRHLPNLQRLTVARFSRRNDAEAYLLALQRLMPAAHHVIIFANPLAASDGRNQVRATCNRLQG